MIGLVGRGVPFWDDPNLEMQQHNSPNPRHPICKNGCPYPWLPIENHCHEVRVQTSSWVLPLEVRDCDVLIQHHGCHDNHYKEDKEAMIVSGNAAVEEETMVVAVQVAFPTQAAMMSTSGWNYLWKIKQLWACSQGANKSVCKVTTLPVGKCQMQYANTAARISKMKTIWSELLILLQYGMKNIVLIIWTLLQTLKTWLRKKTYVFMSYNHGDVERFESIWFFINVWKQKKRETPRVLPRHNTHNLM